MLIANWRNAFTKSWTNEIRLSDAWNREKYRPTFWLLLAIGTALIATTLSGEDSEDPWTKMLLQKGWGIANGLCPNLAPSTFAETNGVEVYRARDGLTWASRSINDTESEENCHRISQPTFVEEI